jgi:hypothetical protein
MFISFGAVRATRSSAFRTSADLLVNGCTVLNEMPPRNTPAYSFGGFSVLTSSAAAFAASGRESAERLSNRMAVMTGVGRTGTVSDEVAGSVVAAVAAGLAAVAVAASGAGTPPRISVADDALRLAILRDFEVGRGEIADRVAVLIENGDVDEHTRGARTHCGSLILQEAERGDENEK